MKRLYEDPEEEAASLLAWIDRRYEMATSIGVLKLYYRKFLDMWLTSFGTLTSVPQEYQDKFVTKYREFQKEDDSDE